MNDKVQETENLFLQGFNCSQSVLGAFSDEIGLDRETALRLSSSFGAGMGRLREVCGAVTAMFMTVGLKYGYSDPNDSDAKTEHYRMIQELAEKFRRENGSIICRELLGLPAGPDSPVPSARTKEYYANRPCAEIVKSAAKLLEDYMEEKDCENRSNN